MSTEMFRSAEQVSRFNRKSFSGKERFTSIGTGSLGAKAHGLASIKAILEDRIAPLFRPAILVDIPLLTVIAADFFDLFMKENCLLEEAASARTDEQIARAFQQGALPAPLVSDLRAFAAHIRVPLAVRSSSLLEDAVHEPLAGAYVTKMIPNNQPDLEDRLRELSDVIKYVYASTFFKKAKDFLGATRRRADDEKMAVIIQEVVGACRDDRFYPHVSGVARSFNFYPIGLSRPGDGVVELALGLGKTIVDDGIAWSVSPAYPHVNPPYNTLRDLLKRTQKEFWAIDMTVQKNHRVMDETEHLKKYTLVDAEQDGTLSFIASTYEIENENIVMGITGRGPRIVDFGQILKAGLIPVTALLKEALNLCEQSLGTAVEIEFAMTFSHPHATPARFGFLQVRPMVISHAQVDVHPAELTADTALVASESALGNGREASIWDVVYVKPRALEATNTRVIGLELESINHRLVAEARPYVLIGFGRWGSSDPSVGIQINLAQSSGAKVIVEATLPNADFILSQGSHFFHNITSSKVLYFSVSHTGKFRLDWEWLDRQRAITETEFTRHVRLSSPLSVKVDGRTNRGVIRK